MIDVDSFFLEKLLLDQVEGGKADLSGTEEEFSSIRGDRIGFRIEFFRIFPSFNHQLGLKLFDDLLGRLPQNKAVIDHADGSDPFQTQIFR